MREAMNLQNLEEDQAAIENDLYIFDKDDAVD
jgi:hypothetical protein